MFGEGDQLVATIADFTSYLDGLPRLSVTVVRFCEKPIITTEIQEAMSDRTSRKSLGLDGLPYEFYFFFHARFVWYLSNVSGSRTGGFLMLLTGVY